MNILIESLKLPVNSAMLFILLAPDFKSDSPNVPKIPIIPLITVDKELNAYTDKAKAPAASNPTRAKLPAPTNICAEPTANMIIAAPI